MGYIIPKTQPKAAAYNGDDEGFVQDILTGLRSLPHLPAALTEGPDAEGITPEESSLRRRALSEAAMWVVPALVTGGAGALLKTAGPLVQAIVSGVGGAAGMGLSAQIQGEDVGSAALTGGLFTGALGGGIGLMQQGAKKAAQLEAAQVASRVAQESAAAAQAKAAASAQAASKINRAFGREAVSVAEDGTLAIGGKPFATAEKVVGQQQDLFDAGLQPFTGKPNVAVPQGEQLGLFGEAPTIPGARSNIAIGQGEVPATVKAQQDLYSIAREMDRPNLPGLIQTTDRYTAMPASQMDLFSDYYVGKVPKEGQQLGLFEEMVDPTTIRAAEQSAAAAAEGKLIPATPKTFGTKVVEEAAPATEGVDAALMNEGITPSAAVTPPSKARKVKKLRPKVLNDATARTFAPETTLEAGIAGVGEALLKGDVLDAAGRAIKLTKSAANQVNQSAVMSQGFNILDRAMRPARATLGRMGPAGVKLAATFDKVFDAWRMRAGKDVAVVRSILDGFTEKERIHIGEVMEGLAIPGSEKLKNAADALSDLMRIYGMEAKELGIREMMPNGDIKEFEMMRNYFPHYISEKSLKQHLTPGTPEFDAAVRHIKGVGQARTTREAQALVKKFFTTPAEFRTGPINFVRSGNFKYGYEKDPAKVLSKYIYDVSKRLEITKEFGPAHKGAQKYIDRIAKDGHNAKIAQNLYTAFVDKLPNDYMALTQATGLYNVLTMLSTSGIVQPAQMLNIAGKTSYKALLQGIGALQSKQSQEWAVSTGAHINEVVQDMLGVDPSRPAQLFTKAILLEPLDKLNRTVAALAGRFHAIEVAERFVKKQTPRAAEQLTALGLSPAEVLAQRGVLTNDQLRTAGYKLAQDTQFASSVMDLPEFTNHPLGKVAYQFRNFALQQAEFIRDDIMKPAWQYGLTNGRKGSLAPLARYSAGLGPTGAVIGELVRGIKGKVTPDDPVMRQVENIAYAGGFGIYKDLWDAMNSGPDRILAFLGGPTAGELSGYLGQGVSALKGNPEALLSHITRRIPIIGQPLANYWLFRK